MNLNHLIAIISLGVAIRSLQISEERLELYKNSDSVGGA